jgi:hypothetical protein
MELQPFYRYGDYTLEIELFENDGITPKAVSDFSEIKIELVNCTSNEILQSFLKSKNEIVASAQQPNLATFIFSRKKNVKLGPIRLRCYPSLHKDGYLDNIQVIPFGTEPFANIID